MTRQLFWTDRAQNEYYDILDYIAVDNPEASSRVGLRIAEVAKGLLAFATGRAGRVHGTYEKIVPGLPYILAYAITAAPGGGEMVAILHVIHTARDWPDDSWPSSSEPAV